MKSLTNYTEKLTTELLEKTGAFFAFSDKQFNEKKIEGVEYIGAGCGLIVPKEKAETLKTGLDEIYENGIKQDLQENGKDGVIRRELYNHEAFYTYDLTSTYAALSGYGITRDEVQNIFEIEAEKQD